MTADLKAVVFSWDYAWFPDARGIESYEPSDPTDFCVSVQAFIGPGDSDPSDSFDFVVCSPKWLLANFHLLRDPDDDVTPPSLVVTQGIWIMESWSSQDIESNIRRLCEVVSPGPDWGSVADRLGRWMPWEYDYRYDDFRNNTSGARFPPDRSGR